MDFDYILTGKKKTTEPAPEKTGGVDLGYILHGKTNESQADKTSISNAIKSVFSKTPAPSPYEHSADEYTGLSHEDRLKKYMSEGMTATDAAQRANNIGALAVETIRGIPKAATEPIATRTLFGKDTDTTNLPRIIAGANDFGARIIELLPKVASQAYANYGGTKKAPFDISRLGFEPDPSNVVQTSGARAMEALNKYSEESPDTPIKNALKAAFVPINDVLDAWFAGDLATTGAVKVLEGTRFNPQVTTARAKLGLDGQEVSLQSIKDQFIQRGQNIISKIKEGENVAKYKAEFNDLGKSTGILIEALNGKGVSTLNKFGQFMEDFARIALGDVSKGGNPFQLTRFGAKPLGESGASQEALPGYVETPGQAPAMGLSIRKVERVGGAPKTTEEETAIIKEASEKARASVPEKPVDIEYIKTGKKTGKSSFSVPAVRDLTTQENSSLEKVNAVLKGQSDTEVIAHTPGFIAQDGKSRPLIFSKETAQKIKDFHGDMVPENFVLNANDWDFALKNVKDKSGVVNPDKINLIKLLPNSDKFLLIGANRDNGFFTVTHFEYKPKTKNELKNLLQNKGDALDRSGRTPSIETIESLHVTPFRNGESSLGRFSGVGTDNVTIQEPLEKSTEVSETPRSSQTPSTSEKPNNSYEGMTDYDVMKTPEYKTELKGLMKNITPDQSINVADLKPDEYGTHYFKEGNVDEYGRTEPIILSKETVDQFQPGDFVYSGENYESALDGRGDRILRKFADGQIDLVDTQKIRDLEQQALEKLDKNRAPTRVQVTEKEPIKEVRSESIEKTPKEILAEAEAKARAPKAQDIVNGVIEIAQQSRTHDAFMKRLTTDPVYAENLLKYDRLVRDAGYQNFSDLYAKERNVVVPKSTAKPIVEVMKTVNVPKPVEKPVVKPISKVGVSSKEVPIAPEDAERIREFAELKSIVAEQLENHPGKKLQRFISKEGVFEDTGVANRKTIKGEANAMKLAQDRAGKISSVFETSNAPSSTVKDSYDDPDAIRAYIDEYNKLKEYQQDIIDQEREFKVEARNRQIMKKSERALEKIADRHQTLFEKQVLSEQQRVRRETLKKNIAEREEKLMEISHKVQEQVNRIDEARQTQLPAPLNLFRKIDALFRPLKYLDDKTKDIFRKWRSDNILSYLDGKKESKKLADIPAKEGMNTILNYQAGKSKYQGKIRKVFDDLYDQAQSEMGYNIPDELAVPDREGFLDASEAKVKELGYLKNYLPQVWADSKDQLKSAVQKFLEAKGLSKEQVQKYLDGEALNNETAARLKVNPRFQKEKVFPTYEVGMQHGLTPKYTHPAQLAGWYMEELKKVQANREFLESLIDQAKILTSDAAPAGWKAIDAPFIKGEVYKAPPRLANVINGIFRDEENLSVGETVLKGLGKVSGTAQDVILTSGVPGTQINSFSMGTAMLDLTRGDLKSAKAILRSNFNEPSRKFFEEHNEDLYRMARQGIDVGKTIDGFENAWKVNRADPQFYNKFIHKVGDIGSAAFSEKIFNSYIPQVMVQIYSDVYKRLIKKGISPLLAEKQAADILRTTRAISENEPFRSKGLQDFMKAFFFAPRYREAMIKVYGNTLKSVTTKIRDPKYRNLRALFVGAVITYALYNYWNYKNTGHFMWQNEPGHEFDLKFELDNGTYIYTPFLGSTSAVVRNLATGAIAAVKGDTKTAGQKFGGLLSVPFKTVAEVLSNRDFFGNEIYNEYDTNGEKTKKIAGYVGVAINHPYIAHLVKYLNGSEPGYQALSYALELPIKYSSEEKEAKKEFYNELDKENKEAYQAKQQFIPTYQQIRALATSEKPEDVEKAQNMLNEMPDDQYKIYQSLRASEKRADSVQLKTKMYPVYQNVRTLIDQGKKDEALTIVNAMSDDEYKAYQALRKSDAQEADAEPKSDNGIIVTYLKAFTIDPKVAFKAMFTKEVLDYAKGNVVVLQRIPFIGDEGSEAIAQKRADEMGVDRTEYKLDHTLPREMGGDNSLKNLQLITTEEWETNTPVENYLGKLLRDDDIKRKDAQAAIIAFKNKEMTFAEIKEKYKPKEE